MKLLDDLVSVNAKEYSEKKAYYLDKYVRSDFILIPFHEKWERRLVECMSISNHWLCKRIRRYDKGTSRFSFYTFSRAKIIVEHKKSESVIRIAFPKSLGYFKYFVAKELYMLDKKMRALLVKYDISNGQVAKFIGIYTSWFESDIDMPFSKYLVTKL